MALQDMLILSSHQAMKIPLQVYHGNLHCQACAVSPSANLTASILSNINPEYDKMLYILMSLHHVMQFPKFWRGMLRDPPEMICWPEMTPVVRLNMVPCKNAAQRPIAWQLASSIPTSAIEHCETLYPSISFKPFHIFRSPVVRLQFCPVWCFAATAAFSCESQDLNMGILSVSEARRSRSLSSKGWFSYLVVDSALKDGGW